MKNKLSAIEELRLEKTKLMGECKQYEEELGYRWDYTKNNFGHLLANTFISSTKSGFSELLGPLLGKKSKRETSSSKSSSGVGQLLIAASPIAWEILQPILLGFLIKKVKSTFRRKKKKK